MIWILVYVEVGIDFFMEDIKVVDYFKVLEWIDWIEVVLSELVGIFKLG